MGEQNWMMQRSAPSLLERNVKICGYMYKTEAVHLHLCGLAEPATADGSAVVHCTVWPESHRIPLLPRRDYVINDVKRRGKFSDVCTPTTMSRRD